MPPSKSTSPKHMTKPLALAIGQSSLVYDSSYAWAKFAASVCSDSWVDRLTDRCNPIIPFGKIIGQAYYRPATATHIYISIFDYFIY